MYQLIVYHACQFTKVIAEQDELAAAFHRFFPAFVKLSPYLQLPVLVRHTVGLTDGAYVFFRGAQQGNIVALETAVYFVIPLDTADITFYVTFLRFRTRYQCTHAVKSAIV